MKEFNTAYSRLTRATLDVISNVNRLGAPPLPDTIAPTKSSTGTFSSDNPHHLLLKSLDPTIPLPPSISMPSMSDPYLIRNQNNINVY
ncbi:hypothetical protein GEMRC1_002073 [Eukaryota sp. GEM-RC1]